MTENTGAEGGLLPRVNATFLAQSRCCEVKIHKNRRPFYKSIFTKGGHTVDCDGSDPSEFTGSVTTFQIDSRSQS